MGEQCISGDMYHVDIKLDKVVDGDNFRSFLMDMGFK
jgi:hypothetical protein